MLAAGRYPIVPPLVWYLENKRFDYYKSSGPEDIFVHRLRRYCRYSCIVIVIARPFQVPPLPSTPWCSPLFSLSVFCALQDKATGNVSLTLQPSVVLDGKGGEGGGLSWGSESLKVGLKVKGTIAAVKDFGVFIQVHDSEVRRRVVCSCFAIIVQSVDRYIHPSIGVSFFLATRTYLCIKYLNSLQLTRSSHRMSYCIIIIVFALVLVPHA